MRENRRWRCAQRKLNIIFTSAHSLSYVFSCSNDSFKAGFFSVTFQWIWMWTADRIKPATSFMERRAPPNHRSSSSASTLPSSPAILFPVCISSFLSCHRSTLQSVSSISWATRRRGGSNEVNRTLLQRLRAFALSHFLSATHALIFTPPSLSAAAVTSRYISTAIMSEKPFTPSLLFVTQPDFHVSQSFHFCCYELEMFL